MKILTLDIETSPNLGWVFSLWKQNVGLNQVEQFTEVISFAAKWHDKKKVMFHSVHHDGKRAMLQAAFELLSEADVVVGYNSKGFDCKKLEWEFAKADMGSPVPYAQVDLFLEVKKNFAPPSKKLDHIVSELGIGSKVSTGGFDLWMGCLHGDSKSWDLMRKYNKHDVVVTEQLYDRLLPWIKSHPSVPLHHGNRNDACQNCGSEDLKREGYAFTTVGKYQRFQCRGCGKWGRSGKRIEGVDIRNM